MYNPYFMPKKVLKSNSRFSPKTFEELKVLLERIGMLVCPVCGSSRFNVEIQTVSALSGAQFSTEFGIVSGALSQQTSTLIACRCGGCGEEFSLDGLKEVKVCSDCGKSLGKIYRRHKGTGKLYHLDCGLSIYPESEMDIVYES